MTPGEPADVAELLITQTDGRTERLALGAVPLVMGRDAGCDLPIDDPSASRQHAQFTLTSQGYVVEDLKSKNGTLVNDVPCTSRVLADGDTVQIGSTTVVFRSNAAADSAPVVIADDVTQSHATHYVSRDQRLDLSQQRLEMIYALSARLTTLQTQDRLFENAMDICFETLQFERGAIAVRKPNARTLDWPVVRHLRGAEGELTISRTLLTRALECGERAIFTDEGGNADPTVSMVQQGIRSAMCVPLLRGEETLGIVYGDRISTSTRYSNEDIDFLAAIAQQLSIGLINARLMEDQRQMIRMQRDLDLARTIQTGLFPSAMPSREGLKIAALNEPGQLVSGDYYDVLEKSDGRVWCVIADVTGEGIAAALLMANLQAAVRVTIGESDDPGAVLTRWNDLICHNTDSSKFITCLLALIDPASHVVRFASAGHHLPYVLRSGQPIPEELIGEGGFPLGVVKGASFDTITVELGPEPFLLFSYTDGVIEAMTPEQEMFGSERLVAALAEHNTASPASLVKHIRKQVANFAAGAPQSDDITMLAAQVQ